jgi:protein ImuB
LLPEVEAATAAELRPLMVNWALQFTPRVVWVDEALLLELAASVRLFGGRRALRSRLRNGARTLLGPAAAAPLCLAWAPTGLAALALGRAGLDNGFARPLPELLDPLPLAGLTALRPHEAMLHLIGCRSLGALRGLPRDGLARRLDAAALRALDQAYGLQTEAYVWLAPPEQFRAQLELPGRADDVPALMAGAHRLLQSLCGWLAARHLGVCALSLRWHYDSMRARSIAPSQTLTLRTAAPTREAGHLARLLAEHLARIVLQAPVATLALQADEVQPLTGGSAVLWPGQLQQDESLNQVLERLSARLGPERVLTGQLCEDHRPELMQRWSPAAAVVGGGLSGRPAGRGGSQASRCAPGPQPSFLLPEPLPLAMAGDRPVYQGPLRLLLGPQRVESGWWPPEPEVGAAAPLGAACRDYWVAESAQAGVLWIFQTRLADDSAAWFLHGLFA